jgi:uncharacterized protein (DUF2267 family)
MRTTKLLVRATAMTATAIGAAAVVAPDTAVGRHARRLARRLARDVRYAVAASPGVLYALSGRRPDPDVSDDVLADRIRSSIGPLIHRLDVPRIHVTVDDHVAILHGDVPSVFDALRIEAEVMRVSGVRGIESHLHHRLVSGDTRPSEGKHVRLPSPALSRLLDAARDAGGSPPEAAVHAVLCGFADRVPREELVHIKDHLPADVRALMSGPHRHGEDGVRLRTVPQLVAAVIAEGGIQPEVADTVTRAVVAELRALVPEEAQDVRSVLPAALQELWEGQKSHA